MPWKQDTFALVPAPAGRTRTPPGTPETPTATAAPGAGAWPPESAGPRWPTQRNPPEACRGRRPGQAPGEPRPTPEGTRPAQVRNRRHGAGLSSWAVGATHIK